MNTKARKFARAGRRYAITSKLERLGAQAAGLYGHQIHGTFGAYLRQARQRLGAVVAAPPKGRCLTT
eukprot:3351809-Pyramimonas_sp.AAC.1